MTTLRKKLFLSYSRADDAWRELFRKHLKTVVDAAEIWVDDTSIQAGANWNEEIGNALAISRCALILLTPQYLDRSSYSHTELQLLIEEEKRGLTLLPVLIEDCDWEPVGSLGEHQFLRWPGGTWRVATVNGERETLRPLSNEDEHRERAIVQICEQVKKALGVVAQVTTTQFDELANRVRNVLGIDTALESLHSGDFSVVYRAKMGSQTVAIKALPDTPRQNRIRAIVANTLPNLQRLKDPAFIKIRMAYTEQEPYCLVMDYIEWPTLEARLSESAGRRLQPLQVARVLSHIARAQGDAHANKLLIGPLSLGSVHVDPDWDVRLSALRVEGVLARAASMATGQLLNWDALTNLAPETSDGVQPATLEERDWLEQYYLGLLGLELLLGRRPCEVHRFDDFRRKASFFDSPRSFFDNDASPGSRGWTEDCPALAFVLARLLARDPRQRIATTAIVVRDLEAIAGGTLPASLRTQLDDDLEVLSRPEFATGFYERLFERQPSLQPLFRNDRVNQARMLADALQDMVAFDPQGASHSRFQTLAKKHAGYGISIADVQAFRETFLARVRTAFPGAPIHADAWNAVLGLSLRHLASNLAQA